MAQKFEFSKFFDFDTLQANLTETITLLDKAEKQIVDMSKLPEIKLNGNTDDIKANNDATMKLIKLSEEQAKLAKLNIQVQKEQESLAQAKLKTEQAAITLEQKKAKALKDTAKEIKDLNQLLNQEIKTEREAKQANNDLRKARLDVNSTTEDGVKQIEAINAAIDKNNEFIKSNSDALTKQKINIGNYKEDIKSALAETGMFGGAIGTLSQGFNQLKGGFSIAIKGLTSFKAALIGTGIGAILVGIGMLITYFKQTQAGSEKLRVATAAVGAAFDYVISVIAEFGGKIVAAFETAWSWATKLGKALGIVSDETDTLKESEDGLLSGIKAQIKATMELEQRRIDLAKSNRILEKSIADLAKQEAILQQKADDDTLSFKKMKEAAEQLDQVLIKKAKTELDLANGNLKIINDELTLREKLGKNTDDLKDAQLDAQKAVIQAETDYVTKVEENAIRKRKIARDLFEQELDILIDVSDARKTALEKQLSNEKLTEAEQLSILNTIKAEQENAYNEQIKLFEKYTGKKIDFNELMTEDDLKTLNSRLQNDYQFNEITINRLREVLMEHKAVGNDIIDLNKQVSDKSIASSENQYALQNIILDAMREQGIETGKAIITDEEYYGKKIELEKELLQSQLDRLTAVKAADLTDEQIQKIVDITAKMGSLDDQTKELSKSAAETAFKFSDIFDEITEGYEMTDEQNQIFQETFKDSFQQTFDSVSDIFQEINQQRLEGLNTELDIINQSIDAKEAQLEKEKELANDGKVNQAETVAAELATLKKAEAEKKKQIKEEEEREKKFQAVILSINAAITASELVLAAAKAIKANSGVPFVGVVIGLAAAAAIIAGFVALRTKIQGLHDGTEFVDGPEGRDKAGLFALEKGERVVDSTNNAKIPRSIKNSEIPDLINAGLSIETMKTPDQLLTFVQDRQPENRESIEILKKMYNSQQNKEEVLVIEGKLIQISYRDGKIISRKTINV